MGLMLSANYFLGAFSFPSVGIFGAAKRLGGPSSQPLGLSTDKVQICKKESLKIQLLSIISD